MPATKKGRNMIMASASMFGDIVVLIETVKKETDNEKKSESKARLEKTFFEVGFTMIG